MERILKRIIESAFLRAKKIERYKQRDEDKLRYYFWSRMKKEIDDKRRAERVQWIKRDQKLCGVRRRRRGRDGDDRLWWEEMFLVRWWILFMLV